MVFKHQAAKPRGQDWPLMPPHPTQSERNQMKINDKTTKQFAAACKNIGLQHNPEMLGACIAVAEQLAKQTAFKSAFLNLVAKLEGQHQPATYDEAVQQFANELMNCELDDKTEQHIILSCSHIVEALILHPQLEQPFNFYLQAARLKHTNTASNLQQ